MPPPMPRRGTDLLSPRTVPLPAVWQPGDQSGGLLPALSHRHCLTDAKPRISINKMFCWHRFIVLTFTFTLLSADFESLFLIWCWSKKKIDLSLTFQLYVPFVKERLRSKLSSSKFYGPGAWDFYSSFWLYWVFKDFLILNYFDLKKNRFEEAGWWTTYRSGLP